MNSSSIKWPSLIAKKCVHLQSKKFCRIDSRTKCFLTISTLVGPVCLRQAKKVNKKSRNQEHRIFIFTITHTNLNSVFLCELNPK